MYCENKKIGSEQFQKMQNITHTLTLTLKRKKDLNIIFIYICLQLFPKVILNTLWKVKLKIKNKKIAKMEGKKPNWVKFKLNINKKNKFQTAMHHNKIQMVQKMVQGGHRR